MAKPPKKYSNLSKEEIKFIKNKLGITKIQVLILLFNAELKKRFLIAKNRFKSFII